MTTFATLLNRAKERETYWEESAKLQFAVELKTLLDQLNISQRDLAQRAGVSESQISQLLAGSKNLSLKSMLKYTLAVGHIVKLSIVPKESSNGQIDAQAEEREWMSFTQRNETHRPCAARTFWEIHYSDDVDSKIYKYEAVNEPRVADAA